MPPVNVTSMSLNASSIHVAWDLPEEHFTSFIVQYNSSNKVYPPVSLPKTAKQIIISELEGNADYNITIYTVSFDEGKALRKTSLKQTFEQSTSNINGEL